MTQEKYFFRAALGAQAPGNSKAVDRRRSLAGMLCRAGNAPRRIRLFRRDTSHTITRTMMPYVGGAPAAFRRRPRGDRWGRGPMAARGLTRARGRSRRPPPVPQAPPHPVGVRLRRGWGSMPMPQVPVGQPPHWQSVRLPRRHHGGRHNGIDGVYIQDCGSAL